MSKSTKKALPEAILSNEEVNKAAAYFNEARVEIANAQKNEAEAKQTILVEAKTFRETEASKDNFVGLVRVIPDQESPIRCEFRMGGNTALATTQEQTLDELFGASRHILFQKTKVVTAILDPQQLVNDLGAEAWDHLELRVKDGHDETVIAKSTVVSYDEAFLPKKDFIASLQEIVGTLKDQAKEWVRSYLKEAVKPTVVGGTRGKA